MTKLQVLLLCIAVAEAVLCTVLLINAPQPPTEINDAETNQSASSTPVSIDGNIQDFTSEQCTVTPPGTILSLVDTRDNTVYRIKKMADDHCWMIDNLAFSLDNPNAPAFSPSAVLLENQMPSKSDVAQYIANASAYDIPNGDSPTTSYLYNWCAATGDTSTNCYNSNENTRTYDANNDTSNSAEDIAARPDITGICPSPLRLPKGGPWATNNDPVTTSNEFSKLDIAMGGNGSYRDDETGDAAKNFLGTDATDKNWHGVLSGGYNASSGGLIMQGAVGLWWTSSFSQSKIYDAYSLSVMSINDPEGYYGTGSSIDTADDVGGSLGFAIRCLI